MLCAAEDAINPQVFFCAKHKITCFCNLLYLTLCNNYDHVDFYFSKCIEQKRYNFYIFLLLCIFIRCIAILFCTYIFLFFASKLYMRFYRLRIGHRSSSGVESDADSENLPPIPVQGGDSLGSPYENVRPGDDLSPAEGTSPTQWQFYHKPRDDDRRVSGTSL